MLISSCNLKKPNVNNQVQLPGKSLGLLNNANINNNQTPSGNPSPGNGSTNNNQTSNTQMNVTGEWEIGFLVQDKTLKAKLKLTQNGNNFEGTGIDEDTNMNFNIINGQVNPDLTVEFYKQYSDPNNPVVKYTGKLENVNDQYYQGPYLSGEYLAQANGQSLTGIWQAELINPPVTSVSQGQTTPNPTTNQTPATTNPNQDKKSSNENTPAQNNAQGQINKNEDTMPDHPPDLSGKWEVGYESNFKTVHTTLFLEQYNDSLKGHGLDTSTNESFDVEKGWYYFPKVTLVWKYTKGKGASTTRTMVIKASVSMINEKDYQGPYLNGKTQGGGAFEAQLVK